MANPSKVRRAIGGLVSAGVIGAVVLAPAVAGAAPSKSSYNKKVGAACQTVKKELAPLGTALSSSTTTLPKFESTLSQAITEATAGMKKIEAIPRPKGESQALGKAFAGEQSLLAGLGQVLTALQSSNSAAAQAALKQVEAKSTSVNKAFSSLGLASCGTS